MAAPNDKDNLMSALKRLLEDVEKDKVNLNFEVILHFENGLTSIEYTYNRSSGETRTELRLR